MALPKELVEVAEFETELHKWLHESVGISPALLKSLRSDDDWTFVIKMHGILEAGLNHLILSRLREPAMANIVSHLETNDKRTGKIAFIKAYDLLPPNALLFVRMLSEVRNKAVHDVKNFDLNLIEYSNSLNKEQYNNWKAALTWWVNSPTQEFIKMSLIFPREAIYGACMLIMTRSFQEQPERMLEAYQRYLSGGSETRLLSIPKE